MLDKKNEKTFLEREKEDCEDFAKVLRRIPKERKKDARLVLEGFALCAEMEGKKVV
ncbi:MAG: hypothetical protein MR224_05510 [Dorea sp.]|nr:hypothetical protein [Dorea sp.]